LIVDRNFLFSIEKFSIENFEGFFENFEGFFSGEENKKEI